jgi:glycosyltransferase involved in cell wall biosynthesis
MRIAINGWFADQLTTGSGQYLAALTEWLPRAGAGHEWVVVRAGRETKDENRKTKDGNPQSPIPNIQYLISNTHFHTPFTHLSPNVSKLLFEQIAFPRACRRLGADVAFVPYWAAPLWSPCPVVVTIHDLIPRLLPLYRGGALQRAYTALVSYTARRAAAVLTDSEASRRDIIAVLGLAADRVHAVHLAADPRYRPVTDPAELARVRGRYNLPVSPFVLYLGGFDARKNVARTIAAFGRMAQRIDGAGAKRKAQNENQGAPCAHSPHLVIAGRLPASDTPFTPDPRRIAERLGLAERVHFTGWVDEADKPALYSLATAVVFASEYEGFGLPVLEALACDTQ